MQSALAATDADDRLFYLATGSERELFQHAYRNRLPLLLKADRLREDALRRAHGGAARRPLYTVSCHDDLTAADLTGRYLLKGGDTV